MRDLVELILTVVDPNAPALDEQERAELNRALREDPAARDLLADFAYHGRVLHEALSAHRPQPEQDPAPVIEPTRTGAGAYRLWWAASIAAVLALAASVWLINLNQQATVEDGPGASKANVATLTDLESAVFIDSNEPMTLGKTLTSGLIGLASGRAQLMFESTAVVDLIGPCRFVTTGPNRGRLIRGRLEAYVPTAAHGFNVQLPGGVRIVDLGTRFMVEIDDAGVARAVVYEGAIQVRDQTAAHRMTAGQLATITPQGVEIDTMRLSPGESIDVLAMLSHGMRTPVEGGFDPQAGAWTTTWSQHRMQTTRPTYQPATDPIVDGVLRIGPDGQAVTDSDGHAIDLPPCDGQSLGPIWMRGQLVERRASTEAWLYAFDLDDSWFAQTDRVLGLHPNVGICFDLQAIRQRRGAGGLPLTLTGRVADVRPTRLNNNTSGFYIYIDGKPAYAQADLRTVGREARFELPISPEARFVTLIATDGGDSSIYDWQIIGDLRLVNSPTPPPASK